MSLLSNVYVYSLHMYSPFSLKMKSKINTGIAISLGMASRPRNSAILLNYLHIYYFIIF